uniref:Rho-related GTP-binding protein RhoF n=1 Tax=Steinernema glaseri TaxID=37863 RepID=A0A1I7Z8J8_9BILA
MRQVCPLRFYASHSSYISKAPRFNRLHEMSCASDRPAREISIIVLGDAGVGKSSLVFSYALDVSPWSVPDILEHDLLAELEVDHELISLKITRWKDSLEDGQHIPYADVYVVCFSVSKLESLRSAQKKWIPTIRSYYRNTPIYLVGMKADLRDIYTSQKFLHQSMNEGEPVKKRQARKVASRFKNVWYRECCTTRGRDVINVFERSTKAALLAEKPEEKVCTVCAVM